MLDWLFTKPLQPGMQAPGFSLYDQDGNKFTLSQFRGRNVLLVFYPADETPGCRKQLCRLRDRWPMAQARNTVIFGVNPQNAMSHARFRRNRALPFPLLVDEGKRVARLYRAGGPFIRRTVYLVGPEGDIRFARRGAPAPEEVLRHAV